MKSLIVVFLVFSMMASVALARGGYSSGGRGGFSSSRSSGISRSYSAPRSVNRPSVTRSITTTTTRTRSGGYGGYGYHPMAMGGFGMGYGYSNGMMTGLILGNMMHPTGTTVYTGGGYGGQALLYPDGRVVDQSGYQVGNYNNGQFVAQQGGMVAQPVPSDAQPVPVTVEPAYTAGEIIGGVFIVILIISIIGVLI